MAAPSRTTAGLGGLRRSGAVTELLLLYECATLGPTQLRPIADRLGVTVQAVSHSFRQLRHRGLLEVVEGRYRPTVVGVAWLHGTLGDLADDVRARLAHLHVVRTTRALAGADLAARAAVSLEMHDGLLTARPGARGPSRGRTASAGRRGDVVTVTDLEGIVPLPRAKVAIRTLSEEDLSRPDLSRRLARAVGARPGLRAAVGLEAYSALRAAGVASAERFAVPSVAREASTLGVPVTIVVMERDLPRLLAEFSGADPPTLEVRGVGTRSAR